MKFLSVCSGIEAASVAWRPLGWKAWAFSEIDRFPAAVLAHHYPETPNFGDMTGFKDWPDATLDLLCGGTPCQSFSNAGLRAGLDDPRGQLMLTFGAIAARYRPRWLVWENVPGVLSSNGGRDFGAFLGLLGFLGYGFAYRVLDAQFVRVDGHGRAVPQRRNRVFVVGCLGDWRSAAAVLLERESLRGDPAPRRSAGARVAATLTRGAESGGRGSYASRRQEDDINIVAGALAGTGPGAGWRIGADEAAANHCIAIQGSMIGRADDAGPAASGLDLTGASFTLTKQDVHAVAVAATITAQIGEQTDMDARNGNLVAHAFDARQRDVVQYGSIAGPLDTDAFSQAIAFDPTQITSRENRSNAQPGDPCHTLSKGMHAPAIAFKAGAGSKAASITASEHVTPTLGACPSGNNSVPSIASAMRVRRLTPTECERLMGFPDGYTAITWRGKPAADGPRYKALGNSWATNCARWVGRRIAIVDSIHPPEVA